MLTAGTFPKCVDREIQKNIVVGPGFLKAALDALYIFAKVWQIFGKMRMVVKVCGRVEQAPRKRL